MPPCPIDEAGKFTNEVPDFQGQHVKVRRRGLRESGRVLRFFSLQAADKEIMKRLKENGRLIVQSTIKHSYPFCWR